MLAAPENRGVNCEVLGANIQVVHAANEIRHARSDCHFSVNIFQVLITAVDIQAAKDSRSRRHRIVRLIAAAAALSVCAVGEIFSDIRPD